MVDTRGTVELRAEVDKLAEKLRLSSEQHDKSMAEVKSMMNTIMGSIGARSGAASATEEERAETEPPVGRINGYQVPTRCSSVEFPKFHGEDLRGWVYRCEQFFDVDHTPSDTKVHHSILRPLRFKQKTQMASVNQFPFKNLQKFTQNSKSITKNAFYSVKGIGFSSSLMKKSIKMKQNFTIKAVGKDTEPPAGPEAAVVVEETPKESTEIEGLKKQLVESFYGTYRGLSAGTETRAEIVELIAQLEAKNPTPAPTEALTLLNGKWILAYTSFVGLFPLLSSAKALPLVKLEEISQTIDSQNFTVENSVLFSGPFSTTSISTNAKFEVRSPKLVQIKFKEGVIGTPQLTDSIVLPENVEFLGQNIDLTPIKGLLSSVQNKASSVAKTISSQPPLKLSISNSNAESWILTTYLDNELRISRGDGGTIFVLIKDASPLLTP